jgi:ABC-type transporter Mla subunit MlaD
MIAFKTKVAAATGPRWLHLVVALVPVAFAAPAGAQLQEALTAQAQVDREAAQAQDEIDGIRDRTQDAAGRYAQAMADADSLERFNAQLQEQVESQETELASIEQQLLDIETTNREVQPLMQQMVDTLVRFVELDVPFLLEERSARVQELKDIMARADVNVSEKYRRILEAYQIELEYGRTLSAYEGRLGTGADARTVEFAQLGRVSLMYRTLDGSETGYWDANQKTWVVDESYREAVEEAIRVARRDGAPDLLTVPVPAPQEVRS